jgi:hypothetical protein
MIISISDILHMKRVKEYNTMIISTDAEKYLYNVNILQW